MDNEIAGSAASDGLFMGPVRRLVRPAAKLGAFAGVEAEEALLHAALARAVADITCLMGRVDGEARDILEFQEAMLADDSLCAPVLLAIGEGRTAADAWSVAMAANIAGYDEAEDDYFRARAADLRDIRDRVLRHLAGEPGDDPGAGAAVLVGEDIAPTQFLETDWRQGGAIALCRGSVSGHVAMLARARGVPMVVGLGAAALPLSGTIIVDGHSGGVTANPDPRQVERYEAERGLRMKTGQAEAQFRFREARLKDGRRIELLVNIADAEEVDHLDASSCDGIGLMRSEFLFHDGAPLPDEDRQYHAYRRLVEWAGGRPVTVRTLDIGGDKPLRGLTPENESNPFLGLRGVRLTLAHLDVFKTQLRALARAAAHGPLKVMIPMVTVPDELERCRALLEACIAELDSEGTAWARPPLGIMVEVPAVAVAPDLFSRAAFFSIGSNDLTQYVTAASRDDLGVAGLNDCAHPAVARLIAGVAGFGRAHGIPVSLCGDMASEPRHLASLVAAGLTSLSVAPARVSRIKAALADI